jgi:beta-lactamase regulating signal transducer with metallopeptidase domain
MERLIVEYLANAFWQIPLLAAGVGALLWALGSDVQTRHRVWLAVLAVALLMPLRGMEFPTSAPAPAISTEVGSWTAAVLPAEAVLAVPPPVVERRTPMLVFGEVSTRWLVRLYLGALLFAGWRITRAWFAALGLLRRSRSIHLAPRAMAIFAQAAQRQQIALPRLRQSDETVSPVVIGARHPVLLLPAGFDHLKDDEILAALSHEFAHLARRDYLVNLICQIAALPISWHPATHYIQKRIRDTREMLCDAVAADEMASPVRYATCLVAFAFRALDNHQGALATQGLSMFDNRILEERILQLTQEPKRPEPRTRLARLAGASLGLVMSVTLALLFHITPTLADASEPEAPVQLTPPAELPAPEAPISPTAPIAPIAPVAPVAPTASTHTHTHTARSTPSDEIQRGIAEEKRQQADRQREQADRQREKAQEQAERDREKARDVAERERDKAQHERDAAQAQRDAAQEQREAAQAKREAEREVAQAQREAMREVAEAQREAAREAAQAAREAGEEARHHADEIKRQVAEAIKANEAARDIDMEAIRKEVSTATANVNGPEFKAQMAQLQAHMQQLHDNMSELREHMKEINKEMEKSLNTPM